jgi:hypothetical protein
MVKFCEGLATILITLLLAGLGDSLDDVDSLLAGPKKQIGRSAAKPVQNVKNAQIGCASHSPAHAGT